MRQGKPSQTTVGAIHPDALAYTAGRDIELDQVLVEADCLGTAAHIIMLSRMPIKPPLFSKTDAGNVIQSLCGIIRDQRKGRFRLRLKDQDVHLAVEHRLTRELGDLGRKVHTGRSRNDQVALDLRLYAKAQLLDLIDEIGHLALALLRCARKYVDAPMVGRTHMQKAMPSSAGLWISAFAEGLLDDLAVLLVVYELNDQNPLGAAAGYGVPLPIDRDLVTRLLGMGRTVHNVLHAVNARGKLESMVLQAAGQIMVTLSRLCQDLMVYSQPEFGYVSLPDTYCTGSSIMPQKNNPDVLELVRARSARVLADGLSVLEILRGLPSGYNRDLQEMKEPFINGIATTRASVIILLPMIRGLRMNRKAMLAAFSPEVFATDHVLDQVARGTPFRKAYHQVKGDLEALAGMDPHEAMRRKTHVGAPSGLDLDALESRILEVGAFVREERKAWYRALSKLLGVSYPKGLEP